MNVPVSVTSRNRYVPYFPFLCDMKNFVLLILLLLSSCGLKQIGEVVHSSADGVWYGPSYGKYLSGTCYALVLDYPKGYEWKSDPLKDAADCKLVMLADGIPVLSLKTGPDYEVSRNFARHRIISGKLYSDYTDGMTTVIKEDGHELVRYDGAEEIICFVVTGGKVHTLARHESGKGFVYRIDGYPVLSREDGNLYPHMDVHEGKVSFCFSVSVMKEGGYRNCHYHVTDGRVALVETADDIVKVWDMKVYSGELYMAVSFPQESPVLIHGDQIESVDYLNRLDMVSCTFCDGDEVCLCARFRHSGSSLMTDILWMGGNQWHMYRLGSTLSAVYVDETGYNAVINPTNGMYGIIFDSTRACTMPSGYGVSSRNVMVRKDSILHVGLSHSAGGSPVIWRPDMVDTLKVNGPVICLQ